MKHLSPIIKWTGGKRREIKHFSNLIPLHHHYVEPFVGGGAVFFHLNNFIGNNTINDFDPELTNFYNVVRNNSDIFLKKIDQLKLLNCKHNEMEKQYYYFRDRDKLELDNIDRAVSFVYINQLAFSGMRRFNKKGKFNVPFGHYKKFSLKILIDHIELLQNTDIKNQNAIDLIPLYDKKDIFIFLDPPYTRIFKEYSHNNFFGEKEQMLLKECLESLNIAKWMLIINNSDEIKKLYKNFHVKTYKLKYGVNIKNRFNTDVEHLIITNYNTDFIVKKPQNKIDIFFNQL